MFSVAYSNVELTEEVVGKLIQEGHPSSVFEESLRKLGVEKLSKDDVQKMQWEVLRLRLGIGFISCGLLLNYCLLGNEKVCDQIFQGFDSLSDQCFAEIETIFKGKACTEIRESALGLTKRLAQTAQETFGDFEEAVEKDATKTAVSDGTVHPLTSYVINYVKFLLSSSNQFGWKSKQYKDPALTHLFLMNNIHYMVRSVRRSEAKDLLGDDWVQRHRRIVQQHANQYKRNAWAKVFSDPIE
ncbi:Exocyst complex component EXO70A1 [Vitis vinifera]|uniref:Exocyst subunit Exo70 family protein n=1 Tax=Vitis vinifera TaxID=29760 RepID=A0A438CSE4_VITVI|nr:Exocyst complex component EXO70A1 [Vitis vinifera]